MNQSFPKAFEEQSTNQMDKGTGGYFMKLVTFNIRCDHNQDGMNCFCFRKPGILAAFAREQADVYCFQEVLPHVAAWLKEVLPEYTVVGCGRGKHLDGERVVLAFRKARFDLMKMDTFWLSPTPTVPGSRYPDQSSCPRTCTEVLLNDLQENRVIRVMNTHLDHVGVEARRAGLAQILAHGEAADFFAGVPTVLAGDFNAEPGVPELEPIRALPAWHSAVPESWETFHGYGCMRKSTIDYIFISGNIRCTAAGRWTEEENGVYLSDHYPVWAELEYTGEIKA